MKVLLVEDNEAISKSMKRYLDMNGMSCQTESDGKNALDVIRLKQHDVIILDLAMPVFSGLDIFYELKNNGELCDHKIIINTATPIEPELKEDFFESGILDILFKPLNPRTLLCKLKSLEKNN